MYEPAAAADRKYVSGWGRQEGSGGALFPPLPRSFLMSERMSDPNRSFIRLRRRIPKLWAVAGVAGVAAVAAVAAAARCCHRHHPARSIGRSCPIFLLNENELCPSSSFVVRRWWKWRMDGWMESCSALCLRTYVGLSVCLSVCLSVLCALHRDGSHGRGREVKVVVSSSSSFFPA